MPAAIPPEIQLRDRTEERGECLIWTGPTANFGYGSLTYLGTIRRAHRVVWEMANGPIPEGMCVLHRCDTPPCVRLAHLFLGTRTDNMADKNAKGRGVPHPENLRPGYRGPVGSKHHKAKLTEEQARSVFTLRAEGLSQYEIADRIGIAQAGVWCILKRRTWKHLEGVVPTP